MPKNSVQDIAEKVKNKTKTLFDGVEVVVGPDEMSNHVPLADFGTTYRPDPAHITDFLGADALTNTPPENPELTKSLPAQGYVPPSNHWGENLVTDDRELSTLRKDLVLQAAAADASPSRGGPVSVGLDEMDYDPESEAGDVIPDRDKPNIDEEVPPEPVEPPVEEVPPPEEEPDLPPLP